MSRVGETGVGEMGIGEMGVGETGPNRENKGTYQLRSNCEADQRLCFRYTDSTSPLLLTSEISSFWPSSVAASIGQFVFDLVGNPEDRFYHVLL